MHDSIEYLNVKRPGVNYCFTMDNLSIHKNPIITALVENAGHCVVYCAPYWSCDGAIEYVFNTIHTKSQMANGKWQMANEITLDTRAHFTLQRRLQKRTTPLRAK